MAFFHTNSQLTATTRLTTALLAVGDVRLTRQAITAEVYLTLPGERSPLTLPLGTVADVFTLVTGPDVFPKSVVHRDPEEGFL